MTPQHIRTKVKQTKMQTVSLCFSKNVKADKKLHQYLWGAQNKFIETCGNWTFYVLSTTVVVVRLSSTYDHMLREASTLSMRT